MASTENGQGHSSLTGLRAFVLQQITNQLRPPARVADVGTGTGGLAELLTRTGFQVTAADLAPEFFQPSGIPFVTCDLNADFASAFSTRFDAVVGTEVLEHLENPRHFLRQCRGMLEDDGWLFLTTPNLENPVSKALFLRHDYFLWFSDKNYRQIQHINPISRWYLEKAVLDTGFRIHTVASFGDPYQEIDDWPRMKTLGRLLAWLSKTPREWRGEILFMALRKGN